jgi:hypothetical protein
MPLLAILVEMIDLTLPKQQLPPGSAEKPKC